MTNKKLRAKERRKQKKSNIEITKNLETKKEVQILDDHKYWKSFSCYSKSQPNKELVDYKQNLRRGSKQIEVSFPIEPKNNWKKKRSINRDEKQNYNQLFWENL